MRAMAFLGLMGCASGAGTGDALVGEVVGDGAPTVELADADGVVHDLADRDGVTVIDFSAVWCSRCNDIAPELQSLYDARKGDNVEVWAILFQNNDGDDPSPDDLREWSSVHGLTHPVLADEDEQTFDAWGAGHQPVVFVVAPDGEVVWHGDGPGQNDAIEEAIDGVL